MNSPEINAFIKEHEALFCSTNMSEIENISMDLLVESTLIYGDVSDIKQLFELVGIDTVADIFYRQTAGPRINYHPRTVHYFNLYFERYAHPRPI